MASEISNDNAAPSNDGALTIAQFCRSYGLGRTSTYEAIRERRLVAKKYGKRTLIPVASARQFLDSLPAMQVA